MRTVFTLLADCIDLVAEAVAALGIAVGGSSRRGRDAPRTVDPPVGAAGGDAAGSSR